MQEMVWITRKGQVYKICDMDTSHIQNCVNMIRRKNLRWRAEYLERLELELQIRALGLTSKRAG